MRRRSRRAKGHETEVVVGGAISGFGVRSAEQRIVMGPHLDMPIPNDR